MRGAREEFNPTQVSPSRLNSYVSCGVAFRMNYIDRLPAQASGSAALYGSIWHHALERWAPDRSQNLVLLIKQAWMDYNTVDGKQNVIARFIQEYRDLSGDATAMEKKIRDEWAAQGKESKAPRMTKQWKESVIGKKLAQFQSRWQDRLNRESFYKFTEFDPLASLYDESVSLGFKYGLRNRNLPAPLHTEFHVKQPWRGFILDCYIDTIDPIFNEDGKMTAIQINDYKTYRKVPPAMKDWRQVVMYHAGVTDMIQRGTILSEYDLRDVEILVSIDYVRWTKDWETEDGKPFPPRKTWRVTDADHDRLASELRMYSAGVQNGVFLPAQKNFNPDYCDFPENCCLKNTSAAGGGVEEVVL